MKHSMFRAAGAFGIMLIGAAAHASSVSLPTTGTIMVPCQDSGNGNSTSFTCAMGSTSTATSGYSLLTSSSTTIVAGSTNVGTLYDRVYGNGAGSYIFGVRINLNDNTWDSTNLTFEVNDIFRSGFSGATALSGGYSKVDVSGVTDEYARSIGRSSKGLNETGVGSYDANWVRFETDVNVEDPDDTSPGTSAWYWVVVSGASGYTTGEDAIRLWEAGEEDQTQISLYFDGYVPTYSGARLAAATLAPVPEPTEYAMFLAGLGVLGVMARRRTR
ncbi:PEP-CTERM sorting domain-containing protein [Methyloversatilis thermotolerans]|uniref:PEP-CTERM sorting domain-containing protein n=1 Tax=Methyloversatilis thermotolerans TaxID=1346290 RepID=UPI00037F72B2|nr:PEP-CTERM sorting domain-containing protein [Methyloversatilis thermotolerans]